MQLYSSTITREQLDQLADALGLQLYNADDDFSGARRRRIKLTIRPLHGPRGESMRATRHGRRLWAVSWDGHYAFMRAALALDGAAEFKTALAHWRGLEDFEDRAPMSGNLNVGSHFEPEDMRDACVIGPRSIVELTDMAIHAAARVGAKAAAAAAGRPDDTELIANLVETLMQANHA